MKNMLKKEIYDFYIPLLKKYKSLFILLWISWVISWLSSVLMPVLLKLETDQLVEKSWFNIVWFDLNWFEIFIFILLLIFLVNLIQTLISWITNIFTQSKNDLLANEIQYNMFSKMQEMEIWKAMSSRYKYISSIVEADFTTISNTIINLPSKTLDFLIKLFWITAIYFYFDPILLLIVVLSALVWYSLEFLLRKVRTKYEVEWKFTLWRQVWKYSYLFLYQFSNLAISGWVRSSLKKYWDLLNKENTRNVKLNFSSLTYELNFLINDNLRDILLKLFVWYGVFAWTKSVWMVVLVVSSMWFVTEIVEKIIRLRISFKDFMFKQESILLMLNICKKAWDEDFLDKLDKISIKNLEFSYPNLAKYEKDYMSLVQKHIIWTNIWDDWLWEKLQELLDNMEIDSKAVNPTILKNINLEFSKWNVYWIVWKNWEWKTTLMYLLSGFFRNYNWEIFFNDKNSKNFKTQAFLDKVSFLTQTPFFLDWNSNVRDNILLWVNREVSDEEIFKYLEKFWIDKKVKKHKKWLSAEIWDDIEFSWGEKQIITFIRLLLQDRDVIVMDEWTNQLDAENEVLVMKELLSHKKDKIIIFITHRMSTISKVDTIYCLENWIISDMWNHKTLLEKESVYSRFYKAQILD